MNLQTVLTLLASMGGVAGLLGYARGMFLDKLLAGLDATQRDYVLRGLLILLNFGAILGGLVAQGAPMSSSLLLQAVQMTAGAVVGGHLLFNGLQKSPTPTTEPDEIPEGGPGIPPPDDTPAAAALAA